MIKQHIWYKRSMNGLSHITVENLPKTHVYLRTSFAADNDAAYLEMQGDVWSPHGEARPLCEARGMFHTSMSIGDVLYSTKDESFHVVMPAGFRLIERQSPISPEQYDHMCLVANDWRYLTCKASTFLQTRADRYWHNKRTGKSQLDLFLMRQFALTHSEARMISNHSVEDIPYTSTADGVAWVADRPEPKITQYPELSIFFPHQAVWVAQDDFGKPLAAVSLLSGADSDTAKKSLWRILYRAQPNVRNAWLSGGCKRVNVKARLLEAEQAVPGVFGE